MFSEARSAGQTKEFQRIVVRVFSKLESYLSTGETKPLAGRNRFISQLALEITAIPFAGFTSIQFSDIHCGRYRNKEWLNYGVDLLM